MSFWKGKFGLNIPNIAFFGTLLANIRSFEIPATNFTTGSLSFWGEIGNSYWVIKFWPPKRP